MSRKPQQPSNEIDSWLEQHGDRTLSDIEYDDKGNMFVFMWSGILHTYIKQYLPKHLQY